MIRSDKMIQFCIIMVFFIGILYYFSNTIKKQKLLITNLQQANNELVLKNQQLNVDILEIVQKHKEISALKDKHLKKLEDHSKEFSEYENNDDLTTLINNRLNCIEVATGNKKNETNTLCITSDIN
jgi:hypothetical protein